MNISEFAKSRAVDAQTVGAYLRRHKIPYSRSEGLSEEAMELLDKKYPVPADVVIRVKDEESEKLLREKEQELDIVNKKLVTALEKISELKDDLLEANEKFFSEVGKTLLLEDKLKQIEKMEQDIKERDAEIERLKNRGLIARLMNT